MNNFSQSPNKNDETLSQRSSNCSDELLDDKIYNVDSDRSNSTQKRKESLKNSIIYLQNTGGGSGGTTDDNPFVVTVKSQTKKSKNSHLKSSVDRDSTNKGRDSI